MSMNILIVIVNTILSNKGRVCIEKLSRSMKLRDDLNFDSLDLAELTVRIEAQFGIDIFEDGLVDTIGGIFDKLSIHE